MYVHAHRRIFHVAKYKCTHTFVLAIPLPRMTSLYMWHLWSFKCQHKCHSSRRGAYLDGHGRFMTDVSLIWILLRIYAFCSVTLQFLSSGSTICFPSLWIWADYWKVLSQRICNQNSSVLVIGLKSLCILFLFSWPLPPSYKQAQASLLLEVRHMVQSSHHAS